MRFAVQDLITDAHVLIHADRLKSYADDKLNASEDLCDTIAHNSTHCNKAEKPLYLRNNFDSGIYAVQCNWIGFGHKDPTWEPFVNMTEDILTTMDAF